jgi:hypothetical protein
MREKESDFALILFIASICAAVTGWQATPNFSFGMAGPTFILSVASLLMLGSSLWSFHDSRVRSAPAVSFVEGMLFIQGQARRLDWKKGRDLASMQSMDHGELNMLAFDILVAHAKDVLANSIGRASNNPENPDISDQVLEESREAYDAAMADLKKAYNTLKNFSLVTGEGYGPYFKAAQEPVEAAA